MKKEHSDDVERLESEAAAVRHTIFISRILLDYFRATKLYMYSHEKCAYISKISNKHAFNEYYV